MASGLSSGLRSSSGTSWISLARLQRGMELRTPPMWSVRGAGADWCVPHSRLDPAGGGDCLQPGRVCSTHWPVSVSVWVATLKVVPRSQCSPGACACACAHPYIGHWDNTGYRLPTQVICSQQSPAMVTLPDSHQIRSDTGSYILY